MNRAGTLVQISILCLAVVTASPSAAEDGRIEISQLKVIAGGITPGDTPGFPASLTVPGSYVLSTDLINPSAFTEAIRVTSSNVSVDLNGFTLIGPRNCTGEGANVVCSIPGFGAAGIRTLAPGVIIRNGAVEGFAVGIQVANGAIVTDVIARANSIGGVETDSYALVSNVVAVGNASQAVAPAFDPGEGDNLVIDTNVRGSFNGFFAQQGSTALHRVTSQGNAADGLFIRQGLVTSASLVENSGRGAVLSTCSLAIGSTSRANTNPQLAFGSQSASSDVVVTTAGGAAISGTTKLDDNLCDGVACP